LKTKYTMPSTKIYEYAILRLVPRVERGEYINLGVVLYCKHHKTLGFISSLNPSRTQALFADIDIKEIEMHLLAFDKICRATADSGPIGQLDQASRFRWLTAKRSTCLQTSEVHTGYCTDPKQALQKIFNEMVTP
jgi:Protein of unknown function (DUF3037)